MNTSYLNIHFIFQRQKAHSLYENKIGELMHNEKQAQLAIEKEKEEAAELKLHKVLHHCFLSRLRGKF